MRKFFVTLMAVTLSLIASSCTSTHYARSSSKAGMHEQGGAVAFNPFADMVNISVNAGVYAGGGGSYRGGSCPPPRPQYGGSRYQQRPPQYYGQQRPPQQPCGYRPQPQCRPQQGGGYYGGAPRRQTLGSHYSNPIRVGPVEFSDSNPGGVWR